MYSVYIDDKDVTNALNELSNRVDDMRPVLSAIGEHIASEVDLTFRDAADPYGNKWNILKHRSGKPLNDTGRLRSSITSRATSDRVEIGTNVEYAGTHQHGAKKGSYGKGIPWGDIPARPFLPTESQGLPESWQRDILDMIENHFR